MVNVPVLPEYGPLEIDNLQQFLNDSKLYVAQAYNTTSTNGSEGVSIKKEDLKKVKTIGIGSFGVVFLVKDRQDNHYALKAINKKHIVKTKQVSHILNEKKILSVLNFPFVVHLVAFFSDNSYLYYLLPFISGGDFFSLLKKFGKFDESMARFYAAQIVLALEYLHFVDLIYRDLKPENVLMDHTGYLKLTDFGFGKHLKTRTWTLCGTPEYLAPEILLNKGYSKSVDWWAFGVILFELVAGRSPFYSQDNLKIYEKILSARYIFPSYVSLELKTLISNLLQIEISLRYGSLRNGVNDVKNHIWFRPIEWNSILNRKLEPPYIPSTRDVEANFEYCKEIELKTSETGKFEHEFKEFYTK